MKRFNRLFGVSVLTAVLAAILITGCGSPLTSTLPEDSSITLGIPGRADGATEILAVPGGKIWVPVTIDSGDASWNVNFTLSADADMATTGDNTSLGEKSVSAESETMVGLDVPSDVAAGTYTLFGTSPATGEDPGVTVGDNTWNLGAVPVEIIASDNAPDLEVAFSAGAALPYFYAPGSSITGGLEISNTGYARVEADTEIPVSLEWDIEGSPESAGSASVTLEEPLYPQCRAFTEATVTLPSLDQMAADDGITAENLDLWADGVLTATVDPDNDITEITGLEGGTDTLTIKSGVAKPDLSVNLVLPDSGFGVIGGSVEAVVELENDGYAVAPSGDYGVDLFIDENTNGDYDDGENVFAQWEPGDAGKVSYDGDPTTVDLRLNTQDLSDAVYPEGLAAGTYDVGAVITGTLDEYNTGNNTATASIDLVTKDVDLELVSLTSSHRAILDEDAGTTNIPVTLTVRNNGSEKITDDFTVQFYASDDGVLGSGADQDLGTATFSADVPGGGLKRQTLTAVFDGAAINQDAQFYTLWADLDSADAVPETDEANNSDEGFDLGDIGDSEDNTRILKRVVFLPAWDSGSMAPNTLDHRLIVAKNGQDGSMLGGWGSESEFMGNGLYIDTRHINTIAGSEVKWINLDNLDEGTVKIQLEGGYAGSYCFRIIPEYVDLWNGHSLVPGVVPQGRTSDSYEPNGSEVMAADLDSQGANPLFGWVNAYVGEGDTDYYTFNLKP